MVRSPLRRRRSLMALALVLALAGCGVKANSSFDPVGDNTGPTGSNKPPHSEQTTTTRVSDESNGPGGPGGPSIPNFSIPGSQEDIRAAIIQAMTQAGLDQDQAECLADKALDQNLTDPSQIDPGTASDIFGECHISITDFTGPGGN